MKEPKKPGRKSKPKARSAKSRKPKASPAPQKKRLIFCFDGTWNRIDSQNPTNVARIAQSVSRIDGKGVAQLIHYDEGVGTDNKWLKMPAGMFGWGLKDNIVEAYHFLVLNYEPGDDIIVFGFSRGAFSARSFVGMINNCGIISRRALHHIRDAKALYTSKDKDKKPWSDISRQFRFDHCRDLCLPGDREWRAQQYPEMDHSKATDLAVQYVGIWDTVGALGVPKHLRFIRTPSKYRFHDTRLSDLVKSARHAVAVDERRGAFEPTFWSNLHILNAEYAGETPYQQQLFPGTHGSVGGGGPVRGLSDAALDWVIRGARKVGVGFDTDEASPLYQLLPDHRASLFNVGGDKKKHGIRDWLSGGFKLKDRDFGELDQPEFHASVARRYHASGATLYEQEDYRPRAIEEWWPQLEAVQVAEDIEIDEEQLERKGLWDDRALRAPASVREYTVRRGENLTRIAEAEMGGAKDWQILYLHNRNIGLMFDPDELYANQKIEIPVYGEG